MTGPARCSQPPPEPSRTVYVTVRCPGCGMDSVWLGLFSGYVGTRYVPGECGCSLVEWLNESAVNTTVNGIG